MFTIECRKCRDNTWEEWFRIWESHDGADCANYMRSCVENEYASNSPVLREYRMTYRKVS